MKMKNPYDAIMQFFSEHRIAYQQLEHEPIYTMDDTKQISGLRIEEGVKSLLLKTNKSYILVVLGGNQRLHSKKIKKLLQVKEIRFANPDEVKEIMSCEIGSCYPFGNLLAIPLYVETKISQNIWISFTPGIHTKTIKIAWKDYATHVKPMLVDISE